MEEIRNWNDIYLEDGVYELTDQEVLYCDREESEEIFIEKEAEFKEKYPKHVIATAYEVYGFFLISSMPKKFTGKRTGSGFNYGALNLLENCPSKILIIAEND